MLIGSPVMIISQWRSISNHQVVRLKYVQFLIANCAPSKAGKKHKQAFQVIGLCAETGQPLGEREQEALEKR